MNVVNVQGKQVPFSKELYKRLGVAVQAVLEPEQRERVVSSRLFRTR
jgi:hypothetical protein